MGGAGAIEEYGGWGAIVQGGSFGDEGGGGRGICEVGGEVVEGLCRGVEC